MSLTKIPDHNISTSIFSKSALFSRFRMFAYGFDFQEIFKSKLENPEHYGVNGTLFLKDPF